MATETQASFTRKMIQMNVDALLARCTMILVGIAGCLLFTEVIMLGLR
jgi:hypothetical protein